MTAHATQKEEFLTFSVQSGSSGNCIYVRGARSSVLIDAGISGKCASERLASMNVDIKDIDALLVSHDHGDHCRSAGIFQRKFGLPIYSTKKTYQTIAHRIGPVERVSFFTGGDSFEIGDLVIHTHPTPHDGVDGVCFVIEYAGRRLGILTDLGFVFPELEDIIPELDGVYLESNYDPQMLDYGPYPEHLKRRIRGEGGHISNSEAAELLNEFGENRLKWAALSHLSEHNNHPDCALECARAIAGRKTPISVAPRNGVSSLYHL